MNNQMMATIQMVCWMLMKAEIIQQVVTYIDLVLECKRTNAEHVTTLTWY